MSSARCLIVDNNRIHQELVCLVMENLNVHPATTRHSPDLPRRIELERPQLLIVDLEFGRCEGWALLRAIQTSPITRDIPVVCLSTDTRTLERARNSFSFCGGVRLLQKPFDIEEVEQAVVDLLEFRDREAS